MITLKQLAKLDYCPCKSCEAGFRQTDFGFTSIGYFDMLQVLKHRYPKTYKRLLERSKLLIDN